jgi:hypothetical protein
VSAQTHESAAAHGGLYIHEKTDKWPCGTTVLRQTITGEERVWVAADDFMAVQKERDHYRRTLALINATRLWAWLPTPVLTLLHSAGFAHSDAKAMNEIIAQLGPDSRAPRKEQHNG